MVRIGVTGHMNITEATAVQVYAAVRELVTSYGADELTGVSCLARGADSVFARAVLDVGGQLEVVLPSRNYRAVKVKPGHAAEFDDLIARAAKVRVMDFDDAGRQAYEAANEAVLESIAELVAVWDGETGQGGGTGSVVELARTCGVPVTIIWPTGALRE
ncbi:hypothetical protein [Nocardia noduli]|uniref:hypothetical protein n=1 Tax=Nocardia noduli TaxID=2815722 RepID=UPI001C240823|nr:hypothetical protein [Nocardia noduli]